jgi:UDP-glucose 4-epimerase
VTDKKVNWEFASRRAGDPAVLIASNKLARYELKWNSENSSIEQIVLDAYNWSVEHPHGYSL